ncbi:MAG: hypothetical protein ACI9WU_002500 [Myxococcota bacterium]|jgi:hypothetical protein
MGGLIVSSWMVGLALAAPPDLTAAQRVDRARVCFEAMDFACVERETEQGLGLATASRSREVQSQLLALRVESALAQSLPSADPRLAELLAVDPGFDAPGWPTPWLARLKRARAAAPDREPPELSVRLPLTHAAGQPFEVLATTRDRSGTAGVTLFVAGLPQPLSMTTTNGTSWRAIVPASAAVGDSVALWLEASDQVGNGPTRFGTAEQPRRVHLEQPPPKTPPSDDRLVSKWWFWTAIGGAVLVGAAAGVTVWALSQDDAAAPTGPPAAETGNVRVGVPPWFQP